MLDKYGLVKVKNPNGTFVKNVLIGILLILITVLGFSTNIFGINKTKDDVYAAVNVSSFTDLQNAINSAVDNTSTIINITANITWPSNTSTITVPTNKIIVIIPSASYRTLKAYSSAHSEPMFTINSGADVTIRSSFPDFVFDGNGNTSFGYSENASIIENAGTLTINYVTSSYDIYFQNNTDVAIVNQNTGNVSISKAIISNNGSTSGSNAGGGLTNYGTAVIDTAVSFNDNIRSVGGWGVNTLGGAIYNDGNLTIQSTGTTGSVVFSNNQVYNGYNNTFGGYGGAIANTANGVMNLSGIYMTGNAATYGGGIYNLGNLTLPSDDSGVYTSNTATSRGGFLYNEGNADLNLDVSTYIKYNSAPIGGAIYNNNGAFLSLNGGTIHNNTVSGYGGGVYNAGIFVFNNTTAYKNISDHQGGFLYNEGSSAYAYLLGGTIGGNSSARSNEATSEGGGVYNTSDATLYLEIEYSSYSGTGVLISYNTALSGGGIANNGGKVYFQTGTISYNSATEGGGILNYASSSTYTPYFQMYGSNSSIINNTASSIGGGIYHYDSYHSAVTMQITNGTISGNTASGNGNGIYTKKDFNFSGYAIINSNNDVYLYSGATIRQNASLSSQGTNRVVITPYSYTSGTNVVIFSYSSYNSSYYIYKLSNTSYSLYLKSSTELSIYTGGSSTLTYNANGGNSATYGSSFSEIKPRNISFKLISNNDFGFAKTGYVFGGWSISSTATSNTYANADNITITANTTIYAVWAVAQINTTYYTTISAAVTASVNGDFIYLLQDVTFNSNDNCTITNKAITIYGRHIYGNPSSRTNYLFTVGSGGSLSLVSVNIDGNNTSSSYPLILLSSSTAVLNVDYNSSIVNSGQNGITSLGGTINIVNLAIIEGNDGYGIELNYNGILNITDSNAYIRNNGLYGVYLNSSGTNKLNMSAGNINNNSGGIYSSGSSNFVYISGGSISNNGFSNDGGGVYNAGTFVMTNGLIQNNEATNGAGIYNSGLAYVLGGTIDSNSADDFGGGIYNASGYTTIISFEQTVNGNTYTGNGTTISGNSSTDGGGIFDLGEVDFYKNTNIIDNNKIQVINNTAFNNGGGLYNGGYQEIADVYFAGNTAVNGGAIYIESGKYSWIYEVGNIGTVFENNTASNIGGTFFIEAGGTLNAEAGEVNYNTPASTNGIYVSANSSAVGNLTIGNSFYISNNSYIFLVYNSLSGQTKITQTSALTNAKLTTMALQTSNPIQGNTVVSLGSGYTSDISKYTLSNSGYGLYLSGTDVKIGAAKTITLNAESGASGTTSNGWTWSSPSFTKSIVYGEGTTIGTLPTNPTRSNYAFADWWTGTNGSGTQISSSTALPSSNTTYYAKWTYNVTFDANGGTGSANPTSITITDGLNGTLATVGTLAKSGYTFSGWNTNSSGTGTNYSAGATYSNSTGNITLYAKWTVTNYTLTLNANSGTISSSANWTGSGSSVTKTVTYNTAIGTIPTSNEITRTGYTFTGWKISSTTITSSTNWTYTSNQTADAQWSVNSYSITYSLNGGTAGSTNPSSATFNSAFYVSAPTQTGYSFTGWTLSGTNPNYSTAKYGATSSPSTSISSSSTLALGTDSFADTYFINLSSTSGGSVTLTANWQASEARINDTYYATLANAFSASVNGDTIYIVKDTITVNSRIAVNNSVTLSTDVTTNINKATDDFAFILNANFTIVGSSGATITLTGKNTSNNYSLIYVNTGKMLDLKNYVTLTGNTANATTTNGNNGGAIRNGGTLIIEGATISNNSATNFGGAIYSVASIIMTSGNLIGNSADIISGRGGAIYTTNILYLLGGTIGGSTANKNSAVVGGAIYQNSGSVYLQNTYSTYSGTGVTISYNETNLDTGVSDGGGAIYQAGGTLTMNSGTISYNKGVHGGALRGYGTFNILGGTISNNTAISSGGAIRMSNGTVTVTGGTISNNTVSAGDGGAVYSAGSGSLNISGGTISGNSASGNGNGIVNRVTTFNLGGTTNIASNQDIYLFALGTNKIIQNSDLTNSSLTNITISASSYTQDTTVVTFGSSGYTSDSSLYQLANTSYGLYLSDLDLKIGTNYTLTYDKNTGTGTNVTQTHLYPSTFNLTSNSSIGFTKTGYTFAGWNTASNGSGTTYADGASYSMSASSTTLYAQWTANTYSVAFNGNGSTSGSMSNQTFTYGISQNLTANAYAKTGYTFANWNTNSGGTGTSYTDGQSVSNLTSTSGGTVTLYAIWSANTYTVAFNGNGSTSGSMSNQTFTYGISQNLTANAYAKTGYTFANWNTNSGGTGTSYTNSQSVSNLTSISGGTVTLYAIWSANTYSIAFNGNGSTSGSMSNQTFTYGISQNLTANAYAKTGYTFANWNTNSGGTGTSYADGQSVGNLTTTNGATITFYAIWTINSSTLTIDLNGGSSAQNLIYGLEDEGSESNQIVSNRMSYYIEDGVVYANANRSDSAYDNYGFISAYVDLVAGTNYYLTFSSYIISGTSYLTEMFIMLNGESSYFIGNLRISGGNGTYTGTFSVTTTGTYQLRFDPNQYQNIVAFYDIVIYPSSSVSTSDITLERDYNTLYNIPDPTRTGYTFAGWSLSGYGTVNSPTINEKSVYSYVFPAEDGVNSTLTAQWTPNKYYFDVNFYYKQSPVIESINSGNIGFTFSIDVDGVNKKTNVSDFYSQLDFGSIIRIYNIVVDPAFTYYSYNFSSNLTLIDSNVDNTDMTVQITGENYSVCTLYSMGVEYDINYSLNGGSISGQTTSYITNFVSQTVTVPNPTKTGYTFTGWTISGYSGTAPTISGTTLTIPIATYGNLTLTANWTVNTYIETFDFNNSLSDGYFNDNLGRWTFTVPGAFSNITYSNNRTNFDFYGASGWEQVYYSIPLVAGYTYSLSFYYEQPAITYTNSASSTYGMRMQLFTTTPPNSAGVTNEVASVILPFNTAGSGTATITYTPTTTGTYYYSFNFGWAGDSKAENFTFGDFSFIATKSIAYNETYGTLPTTNKTGYTFNGWYTASTGGTQINSADNYTSTNDTTIYAHWSANTNTLTLNANGGTISSNANWTGNGNSVTKTVTFDNAIGILPTNNEMTLAGYTLAGWKVDGTDTITTDSIWNYTSNKTAYAQWTPNNYTYTLSAGSGASGSTTNGWSWSGTTFNYTKIYSYSSSTVFDTLPTSTKTGYTFAGWWTGENGTGTQITSSTNIPIGDITYYANWTVNTYIVVFNGNGSTSGTMSNQTFTYDVAQNLTENAFVKTGNTFASWNTNSSGTGTSYTNGQLVSNLTSTNNGTVTLYAIWTANTYTVVFNGNGSTSGTMSNQTFTYDVSQNLTANAFVKTGNTFANWNTNSSGTGTSYTNGQLVSNLTSTNNGTITLYAIWSANTYNVRYVDNGSTSGLMNDQQFTYGIAQNLTANDYTKNGYTFAGWSATTYNSAQFKNAINGGADSFGNYFVKTSNDSSYLGVYLNNYYVTSGNTYIWSLDIYVDNDLGVQVRFDANAISTGISGNDATYTNQQVLGPTVIPARTWTTISLMVTIIDNAIDPYLMHSFCPTYYSNGTAIDVTGAKIYYKNSGISEKSNDIVVYSDSQSVSNLTDVNEATYFMIAQWTPITYTLNLDGNGGTISSSSNWTGSGATATKSVTYDNVIGTIPTSNEITRTGYTFTGWKINTTDIISSTNWTYTENQTAYAQWTENTYNIAYNLDSGTAGITNPTTATFDSEFYVSAPTKTGYVFTGWTLTGDADYLTAKFGATSSPSTSISSSITLAIGNDAASDTYFINLSSTNGGSVTLTANWTPKTLSIVYHYTSGQTETIDITYPATTNIKNLSHTEFGYGQYIYQFENWNTASNGSGTTYNANDTISSTETSSYTLNLYEIDTLVWKINTSVLSLNTLLSGKYATTNDGTSATSITYEAGSVIQQYLLYNTEISSLTIPSVVYMKTGADTYSAVNVKAVYSNNVNLFGLSYTSYGLYFENITTIILPNNLEVIGTGYLRNLSGLTTMEFPNTIKFIADRTFLFTSSFTNLSLPSSVEYIGEYAFAGRTATLNVALANDLSGSSLNDYYFTVGSAQAFNASYGTSVQSTNVYMTNSTYTVNDVIYSFNNWNTASDGTGNAYTTSNLTSLVGTNLKIYAIYTADEYTLTVHAVTDGTLDSQIGGTVQIGTGTAGATATSDVANNTNVTINATANDGYTFNGWYTAQTGGTQVSANTSYTFTMPTSDTTYYARFTANSYILTLDGNGGTISSSLNWTGSGATATKGVTYNSTIGTIPTSSEITRTGYTFTGWKISSTTITSSTNWIYTSNQTATAQWTVNTYTITYELNDGTWASSYTAPSSYTVESANITLPTINDVYKQGFVFGGWYDNSGLTGTVITTIPTGSTGNKTYYASWIVAEARINTTYYETLANAFTSSVSGDTIYIVKSAITVNSRIAVNNSVTLSTDVTTNINKATDDFAFILNANFTIVGSSGATITLTGKNTSNNYSLIYVNTGKMLDLKNYVTLTGNTANATDGLNGGAIRNGGNLIIEGATISNNSATGLGGAIYSAGTIIMTSGTITGNTAGINGGGVYNNSYMEMDGGTLTGNTATTYGDGVYNNGTLNFNGGNISASNTYAIYNLGILNFGNTGDAITPNVGTSSEPSGYGIYTGGTGSFNMTEGNIFTNTDSALTIDYEDNSTIKATISGGTIDFYADGLSKQSLLINNGYVQITGGNFTNGNTSDANRRGNALQTNNSAIIDVSGGYFESAWYAYVIGSSTLNISGSAVFNVTICPTGSSILNISGGEIARIYWQGNTGTVNILNDFTTTDGIILGGIDGQLLNIIGNLDNSYNLSFSSNSSYGEAGEDYYLNTEKTIATYDSGITPDTNDFAYVSSDSAIILGSILHNNLSTNYDTQSLYLIGTNYILNYDVNGGTGTIASENHYYGEEVTVTSTVPTLTGYTFNGWNTSIDGTGTSYASGSALIMPASNLTLYAQWTANTYTVVFDGNGSTSGTMSNQTFTYDVAQNLTSNDYAKTGYTFTGWNTAINGTGTAYTDSQNVINLTSVNNDTIILYAQWTANSYILTLDGNGGTISSSLNWTGSGTTATKGVNFDSVIGTIPTENEMTRTGYTFAGWKIGATDITSSTVWNYTSNQTATAQWTVIEYSITYNYGDATFTGTNPQTYTIETDLTLATASKNYATFNGWYVTSTDGNWTVDSVISSSNLNVGTGNYGNVELTFTYTYDTYTVNFDANGGTVTPTSSTFVWNGTISSLPTPTRAGYNFTGWNTTTDGTGETITTSTQINESIATLNIDQANKTITIYAIWSINQFTITATVNDESYGSISPSGTVLVNYNDSQSFTITAQTGYQLTDLQIDGTNVTVVNSYTFENVTANHTIYAVFEIVTYNVTTSFTHYIIGLDNISRDGETISPLGTNSYNWGSTPSFTINTGNSYQIKQLIVNGTDVTDQLTGDLRTTQIYTLASLTQDSAISVVFETRKYKITVTVVSETNNENTYHFGATGGTSEALGVDENGYVDYNGNVLLYTVPSTGYDIESIAINGVSMQNTDYDYDISNILEDKNIVVTLKEYLTWLNYTEPFTFGTGTAGDPYQISTPEQLSYISKQVATGTTNYANTYFIMTNDISLLYTTADNTKLPVWYPIGTSANKFAGTFIGDSYSILDMNARSGDYVGLFGWTSSTALIYNVKVYGQAVGNNTIAGLVARNEGTIRFSGNFATVRSISRDLTLDNSVGGVTAYNTGTLYAVYNNNDITGRAVAMGGVVGYNGLTGVLTNGYSIALSNGIVNTLQRTGNVIIGTGGVVGFSENDSITYVYSVGVVQADGTDTGDVIGYINLESPVLQNVIYYNNSYNSSHNDYGVGVTETQMTPDSTTEFNSSSSIYYGWNTANNDIWIIKPLENNGYPMFKVVREFNGSITINVSYDSSAETTAKAFLIITDTKNTTDTSDDTYWVYTLKNNMSITINNLQASSFVITLSATTNHSAVATNITNNTFDLTSSNTSQTVTVVVYKTSVGCFYDNI